MNYFLLKLAFDTAVHFGGSDSAVGSQSSALTLRADTIFSALCHTALEVYGEPALEELLISADADALRISDAMPWRGDSFYLPKPIAASTSPAELSTVERKAVKKLAWIPVSKFDRYTASLHSGTYPLDELDQSILNRYAHPITKDALLEAIAEFSCFYQDAFLSHFPQGHPVANIPDTPHLILGGGTGFLSKTVGYPYLKDDYAAVLFKSRCEDKKRPVHECVTTSPWVDFPTGWDPRAKQSHAMALFTAFHAAALFKSRLRQTKKQTHKRVSAFFGRSSGI